jgi:hypothetical protein
MERFIGVMELNDLPEITTWIRVVSSESTMAVDRVIRAGKLMNLFTWGSDGY